MVLAVQIALFSAGRRSPAEGRHTARNGDSASVLPPPVAQRDAADRRSPMPAADSARRDWPGSRRLAPMPVVSMMRANVPAAGTPVRAYCASS